MTKTKINWSEVVWNPMTGCSRISSGCKNCYAHDVAVQLQSWGNKKYVNGMEINLHDGKYLDLPRKWKKPRLIFVNSMGDLFHEDVPFGFIDEVWNVMAECPQHIFQVLTKRAERMLECVDIFSSIYGVLNNVWLGVTTENQKWWDHRVKILVDTPAAIRWVSLEPLIGSINMGDLIHSLHWIIVGGETAPKGNWRVMKPEWVRAIRDECVKYGIPFFFKHWNAKYARYAKHELDGERWEQFPGPIRIEK